MAEEVKWEEPRRIGKESMREPEGSNTPSLDLLGQPYCDVNQAIISKKSLHAS